MTPKKRVKALTLTVNSDLERKFRQASQRKSLIQDFIHEFLDQFISPQTKRGYVQDMKVFFDFLRSGNVVINHPSEIQSFHFSMYRDHLVERGLAAATINRRLVCIRSFMKWAVASKLASHNPLDTVRLPKVQTESPTVAFDDEEVVRMVNAPDISTHRGRNHRLIMVLLFNLGLRRSELVNIRYGHFVQDRGHLVLRILGKGDKLRLIPIHSRVWDEVQGYITHLRSKRVVLEEHDFLIQTELRVKNTKPMDGSTVYRVIDKYAGELGINKSVSPHSCRATVISHLLDTKHAAIRDVATFAGHANITTTERYDKRRDNLDKNAAYLVDYEVDISLEGDDDSLKRVD